MWSMVEEESECYSNTYQPLFQSPNVLWKKGARNSDLYIDIFSKKVLNMSLHKMELEIKMIRNVAMQNAKSDHNAKLLLVMGKDEFVQGNYVKAMRLFNTALRFSENDSEEEALAYGSRSDCFLKLKMPEECLTDINLAKKPKYPAHLMSELTNRSKICIDLLKSEEFEKEQFSPIEPKLDFDEHKKFAGVADCLNIRRNDKFGRHIITTQDLKVGQTILIEQPFSIHRLDTTVGSERCTHCLHQYRNFIACNSCNLAIFCNKDCMEASCHKFLCLRSRNGSLHPTFPLVVKSICKANDIFPDIDTFMEMVEHALDGKQTKDLTDEQRDFFLIFQLTHHHEKLSESQLYIIPIATALTFVTLMSFPEFYEKYVQTKHQRFLQHLIFHFCHIAEHRLQLTQRMTGDDDVSSGYQSFAFAMYPFACLINHSCVPNAYYHSNAARFVCKVMRPIKKGEQIFITYRYVSLRFIKSIKRQQQILNKKKIFSG